MTRTVRNGWKEITGSDTDDRGIKHHADNDWFSKKNACFHDYGLQHDEYWGRNKRGVKQTSRRIRRRRENNFDFED